MEENMRVLSQSELARLTKGELLVLLRAIASELPHIAENSRELRVAHFNLQNNLAVFLHWQRLAPNILAAQRFPEGRAPSTPHDQPILLDRI
jgi:hypothetical protein